jgi:hypothetical protein
MKSIDIKGKLYVPVNERIKEFRSNEKYKDFKIENEFMELNDKYCVIKSKIFNEKNEIIATGFAREVNGDTYINKTSYVENCETSAIGRALGLLGIGIDEAFASADEVVNATIQQREPRETMQEKPQQASTRTIKLTDIPYKSGNDANKTFHELIESKGLNALTAYKNWCLNKRNLTILLDSEFQAFLDDKQNTEDIPF